MVATIWKLSAATMSTPPIRSVHSRQRVSVRGTSGASCPEATPRVGASPPNTGRANPLLLATLLEIDIGIDVGQARLLIAALED